MTIRIGIHCSIRKSLVNACYEAKRLGCNTMQIFTHSPRIWKTREIPQEEIDQFKAKLREFDISPLVIHIPYLPNLATSDPVLFEKSVNIITRELEMSDRLGADYLIIHPGAFSFGSSVQYGLDRIITAVKTAYSKGSFKVAFVFENVSGGGRRIGGKLEELKYLLDGLKGTCNTGVCLDTAHTFAAGFGLADTRAVGETARKFDSVIGLKHLKVIHLNDSAAPFASGIDRHQHIGKGHIGIPGFRAILNHPVLRKAAFILETPKEPESSDIKNLNTVRKLANIEKRP